MFRRASLSILAAGVLLALAACTDKQAPVGADAGDGGPRVRDGGLDAAAADSGVDDLALPPSVNEELLARMRHLLEAVVQNNPDLAGDVVFPRDGYISTLSTYIGP